MCEEEKTLVSVYDKWNVDGHLPEGFYLVICGIDDVMAGMRPGDWAVVHHKSGYLERITTSTSDGKYIESAGCFHGAKCKMWQTVLIREDTKKNACQDSENKYYRSSLELRQNKCLTRVAEMQKKHDSAYEYLAAVYKKMGFQTSIPPRHAIDLYDNARITHRMDLNRYIDNEDENFYHSRVLKLELDLSYEYLAGLHNHMGIKDPLPDKYEID